MQSRYLLLHVHSIPLNYDFGKIGNYHKYRDQKKESKAINVFIHKLEALIRDEKHPYNLMVSRYTYSLLPVHLQEKMDLIVDWRFKKCTQFNLGNGLIDTYLEIQVLKEWINVRNEWYQLDFLRDSITNLNNDFWLIKPNELQLEVYDVLANLTCKSLAQQKMAAQFDWLQNAEHILWMSKKNANAVYPSPFRNAYDAYINFMNMLSDFREFITD